ncbi:hypothetical protein [Streptomyces xylophagus]|nr:hypothetical protein [Streptomyces xylophagus]
MPSRGLGAGFDGSCPDGPDGWSFATRTVRLGPASCLVGAAAVVSAREP